MDKNYMNVTVERRLKNRLEEYNPNKSMNQLIEELLLKSILVDIIGFETVIRLVAQKSREGFYPKNDDQSVVAAGTEIAVNQGEKH